MGSLDDRHIEDVQRARIEIGCCGYEVDDIDAINKRGKRRKLGLGICSYRLASADM